MKRLALFAFAFTWLAACDSPAGPTPQMPALTAPGSGPSFAKLFNEKFQISGTLFNRCPPTELLAYNGSIHFLVTGESTPTGTDIKIHSNTQGIEGVGLTSGDRYSVIQNFKEDFELSFTPFQVSDEFDVRFRLIRQGSDDNLWVRFTFRFTFPPASFEVIRSEVECRG